LAHLEKFGPGGVENLLRISFGGERKKLFLGELRKSYLY
jgi:hypothetical protein